MFVNIIRNGIGFANILDETKEVPGTVFHHDYDNHATAARTECCSYRILEHHMTDLGFLSSEDDLPGWLGDPFYSESFGMFVSFLCPYFFSYDLSELSRN
jgi:hypothetical protein